MGAGGAVRREGARRAEGAWQLWVTLARGAFGRVRLLQAGGEEPIEKGVVSRTAPHATGGAVGRHERGGAAEKGAVIGARSAHVEALRAIVGAGGGNGEAGRTHKALVLERRRAGQARGVGPWKRYGVRKGEALPTAVGAARQPRTAAVRAEADEPQGVADVGEERARKAYVLAQ